MLRVGVIGFGYWGPNLARNFAEHGDVLLASVCDLDDGNLIRARSIYPYVKTSRDFREVIKDPNIDAVAIATPLSTHFEIAADALSAGKHVLVEKPIAKDSDSAKRLGEMAASGGLVLMVGHTFVYSGAVRKIQELIAGESLGEIYYYDSTRVNLGMFQHDTSVIWDLATHDLSILDFIMEERPIAVSANGINHFAGNHENIAYLTLFFSSQVIAHINVNWLAPVKVRRTLIGGSQRMIVYDDMEPSEKVKIYDKGVELTDDPQDIYNVLVSYRSGDVWVPRLDQSEALKNEIGHFVHCVTTSELPVTGADMGVRIVTILEAATQSMHRRGEPEPLQFL